MANKKRENNSGQVSALVVILCLLVAALAFMLGKGYVAKIFNKEGGETPKVVTPAENDVEENYTTEEEISDDNLEETIEEPEEEVKEEPKKEPKKEVKKKEEPKPEKKVEKKQKRTVTKQDEEDVKKIENIDKNNNSKQTDLELLEDIDRKINMENANQ